MKTGLLLSLCSLFLASCAHHHERAPHNHHHDYPVAEETGKLKVLCFSGTGWYRHPEIPAINRSLVLLGDREDIVVDVSEDGKDLRPNQLAKYDVLILNNCNELVAKLSEKERKSVEAWYATGKEVVALHAALVRQTEWKWLTDLGGCDFDSDSEFLPATVTVDPGATDHPIVKGLPASFTYTADWTNHTRPVTGLPGIQVLLRVDESSYDPVRDYFKERGGKAIGKDHTIAWTNTSGGGRFFYTELGHDVRSLETDFGREHILRGIRWAAGETP